MIGLDATHILPSDELQRIRAGVDHALRKNPENMILLDMARLLNHIEATERAPDMYADVHQFMSAFGVAYDGPARQLEGELLDFRISHMREELAEYVMWAKPDDASPAEWLKINAKLAERPIPFVQLAMMEQLDALVDSVYVTLQTAHKQGFDFNEAWRRVHAANMRKQAAPDGKGKGGIIKPEGWVAPDHSDLV